MDAYEYTHHAYEVKRSERGMRMDGLATSEAMSTRRSAEPEDQKARLAALFADIRARTGLSMKEFAKALGYAGASSIQRYENPASHSGQYLRGEIIERMRDRLPGKFPVTVDEIMALAGPVGEPVTRAEKAPAKPADAEHLAAALSGASGLPSRPNASFPPRYVQFPDRSIPVLGQTSAGKNGRYVLNGQKVRDVFCPPDLEGVEGAYAVQVYGHSMEPKFEPGEMVWLHPRAPVRRGDYVVAQIMEDERDDSEMSSYIKQFVSRGGGVLKLKQFNPDKDEPEILEFDEEQVFSVHKIVFHALV